MLSTTGPQQIKATLYCVLQTTPTGEVNSPGRSGSLAILSALAYDLACRILIQQFSLGTRPHKSRTHNYVSTSAENGPAMAGPAGPVPAPMHQVS